MCNLLFKFFSNFLFLSKTILFIFFGIFILSCSNSSTNPFVLPLGLTINPYNLSPLSAVYVKESINEEPLTVKVKGLYGEPDIIHTYPAGYGTEFEIHGMFPESDNVIEVNDGGRIITKNVNIGQIEINGTSIPFKFSIELDNLSEEKYTNNPELYFLSHINGAGNIAISQNGYVRYISIKSYFYKLIRNNKSILKYSHPNKIYTLLEKEIMDLPYKSHHDMIKIDENYVYLSYSDWGRKTDLQLLILLATK